MSSLSIPSPGEQVIPSGANLFKAVVLIGLLLASFSLTGTVLQALAAAALPEWAALALKWLLISVMAILNGVLILGMGVLAHDAVHRVLFRSGFWNEFWGGLLSAMTLIPFYANRQFHLTHHGYAHQSGLDPESAMHNRRFWLAGTLGSVLGLVAQYKIYFFNLAHAGEPRYRGRAIKDTLFVAAAGLFYLGLVPALGIALLDTVVPMLLVFPLVFGWRALSDHYGIPAIDRGLKNREEILEADEETWHRDREQRSREVSGWVVLTHPWLEWLWSHVNYHEVHHKYPYLSHRYLPQVFEATRQHQPYLVARGYWRSLFHLRHQPYFAARESVRPYLGTRDG